MLHILGKVGYLKKCNDLRSNYGVRPQSLTKGIVSYDMVMS